MVCGGRVETIDQPLMQEIRYLDKLVDELAKGKSMDKVTNSFRCEVADSNVEMPEMWPHF